TRARLAAVLGELAAAVRAYGRLIEADPGPAGPGGLPAAAPEPLAADLDGHLEQARRRQDELADLLRTDPAQRPDGWPLRGEILAHVDRLRAELQPRRPGRPPRRGRTRRPLQALRDGRSAAVPHAASRARRAARAGSGRPLRRRPD
ncbi:MAG TPA: hypothetical protein VKV35_07850, partial [Streptosporangiaceae bacterium]|nr:hypothetical protein [Streptosporangiaceae bacterium]